MSSEPAQRDLSDNDVRIWLWQRICGIGRVKNSLPPSSTRPFKKLFSKLVINEAGKPASAAGPQQFLVWCAGEARASHSRSALASVRSGEARAWRSHLFARGGLALRAPRSHLFARGRLALRARICLLEGGLALRARICSLGGASAPRSHHRSKIVDFASQNANFMKFHEI